MSRAAVVAIGAISPLGREVDAYDVTAAAPIVAIERDETLAAQGFSRPLVARVPDDCLSSGARESDDRATALLITALEDALAGADDAIPGWRARRIGLAIGTSSGGMERAEALFDALAAGASPSAEGAADATYFGPLRTAVARTGLAPFRQTQLVTACAASTWALGVGLLWLRRRAVDVVIAGGYDAHTRFVHAGFDALRATSTRLPAPFRVGREGMSLGEGAGVVVLVREEEARARPAFFVSGFGASTDAVHVTAPDRTGSGLARALRAAIGDADVDPAACVAVSAHATATPFNDAMEARAIRAALGPQAPGEEPVVHAFKAQIGHTLGAAGVLETLAIAHAIGRGVLPATAGEGAVDDDASVRLLRRAEPFTKAGAFALKASAAFGGANAALVVEPARRGGKPASAPAGARAVGVVADATIAAPDAPLVARVTGLDRDAILRVDDLSLLGLTAVAALVEARALPLAALADAALVVGHALATIDVNQRFHARVAQRGPAAAEPRVFPPTSPNLAAGQIAIHFGIKGPSAATCRGVDGGVEALEIAAELVAAGRAERAIVVAVDVVGPASIAVARAAFPDAALATGATAVLVERDAASRIPLDAPLARAAGHRGLARVVGQILGR